MSKRVDDHLVSWDEVKGGFKTTGSGILIGNGASLAVWAKFGYHSLYDRARRGITHPLSKGDREVFRSLQTKNFESVLGALSSAIKITKILHKNPTFLRERYQNIQRALIEAVHSVHVPWDKVPPETLRHIRRAILQSEFVFTTNYDLLLYWAVMADNPAGKFKDYFWGKDNEFDVTNTDTVGGTTRILYLHGGLHLYRNSSGATVKRIAESGANLLELFAVPYEDGATPLFITEGTSDDKLASIRRSDYLSFAYSLFSHHNGPTVVFGHSLSDNDSHIVDAMNKWGSVEVAISLKRQKDIVEHKFKLRKSLPKANLVFFDAATHPLGEDTLRAH